MWTSRNLTFPLAFFSSSLFESIFKGPVRVDDSFLLHSLKYVNPPAHQLRSHLPLLCRLAILPTCFWSSEGIFDLWSSCLSFSSCAFSFFFFLLFWALFFLLILPWSVSAIRELLWLLGVFWFFLSVIFPLLISDGLGYKFIQGKQFIRILHHLMIAFCPWNILSIVSCKIDPCSKSGLVDGFCIAFTQSIEYFQSDLLTSLFPRGTMIELIHGQEFKIVLHLHESLLGLPLELRKIGDPSRSPRDKDEVLNAQRGVSHQINDIVSC